MVLSDSNEDAPVVRYCGSQSQKFGMRIDFEAILFEKREAQTGSNTVFWSHLSRLNLTTTSSSRSLIRYCWPVMGIDCVEEAGVQQWQQSCAQNAHPMIPVTWRSGAPLRGEGGRSKAHSPRDKWL